jgi:hypothetical protein
MTEINDWESSFQTEITRAEDARSRGNEGMARVCARRAVGIVLGEYLRRRNIPAGITSAYDRLRQVEKIPDFPVDIFPLVRHFLVRISTNYTLPIDADLVMEARQIRARLIIDD